MENPLPSDRLLGAFGYGTALAIDDQGALYVWDSTAYHDAAGNIGARASGARILKLTPDGRQTTILAGGVQDPIAVAIDSDGTIYILDASSAGLRVLKLVPGGSQPRVIAGLVSPTGIAVDSRGVLYIADLDTMANPRLIKIYGDGRREATKLQGVEGLGGFHTLAIDSHDMLYYGDRQRVLRISADGRQETLKSPLQGAIDALAVGSTGTLYLVDGEHSQIVALPPSGHSMTIGSGLYRPGGIAVGGQGAVYIADAGNGRIVKVRP